jgi:hypothetical protein
MHINKSTIKEAIENAICNALGGRNVVYLTLWPNGDIDKYLTIDPWSSVPVSDDEIHDVPNTERVLYWVYVNRSRQDDPDDIIEAELAKVDWTEIRDLVERTGNTFVNDDQDRDWKREGF